MGANSLSYLTYAPGRNGPWQKADFVGTLAYDAEAVNVKSWLAAARVYMILFTFISMIQIP